MCETPLTPIVILYVSILKLGLSIWVRFVAPHLLSAYAHCTALHCCYLQMFCSKQSWNIGTCTLRPSNNLHIGRNSTPATRGMQKNILEFVFFFIFVSIFYIAAQKYFLYLVVVVAFWFFVFQCIALVGAPFICCAAVAPFVGGRFGAPIKWHTNIHTIYVYRLVEKWVVLTKK